MCIRIYPLQISVEKINEWFLLERSGLWTAKRMGLKNLIYKAFKGTRLACLKDKPEGFSGMMKIDETILVVSGRTRENQSKGKRRKVKKRYNQTAYFWYFCPPLLSLDKTNTWHWSSIDLIPIITKSVRRWESNASIFTWQSMSGNTTTEN